MFRHYLIAFCFTTLAHFPEEKIKRVTLRCRILRENLKNLGHYNVVNGFTGGNFVNELESSFIFKVVCLVKLGRNKLNSRMT